MLAIQTAIRVSPWKEPGWYSTVKLKWLHGLKACQSVSTLQMSQPKSRPAISIMISMPNLYLVASTIKQL